jgi:RHS repeat-associated protein
LLHHLVAFSVAFEPLLSLSCWFFDNLRADAGAGFNYPFLTQKERDNETGLDYFLARYYSNTQGRFTSVDPEQAGARSDDPQSWNGYAYARNSPLVYTDPLGRDYRVCDPSGKECVTYTDKEFDKFKSGGPRDGYTFKDHNIYYNGELTATYSNDCLSCEGLINGMAQRGPAVEKLTGGFFAAAVILGTTGGAGAYVLGTGATVTTLGIASRAAPAAGAAAGVLNQLSRTDVRIFQRAGELGASAQNAFMNNLAILRDALFQVAGPDKQITQIGQIGNSPVFGSVVSRVGIAEINGVTMVVRMTHGNPEVLGPLPY